jgi:hypothetical protein
MTQSVPPPGDPRQDAPAFHRNKDVITERLTELLSGRHGAVLEVGSGTGQHIVVFARTLPELTWWPSDVGADRLASIGAWSADAGLGNLMPPSRLDVASDPWRPEPLDVPLDEGLAAMVSMNVIHISPWNVAEGLFRGAGRHLLDGAPLVLYGPFKRDGAHTAPSNAAFDDYLKQQDPRWGVRDMADVTALAEAYGLTLTETRTVPANNFILSFEKTG